MTVRPSTAAPILTVLAIGLVTLMALYVFAYWGLGEWHVTALVHCRAYRTTAEARLFAPAAAVESYLTGRRVVCWVRDTDSGIYQP